VQDSSQPRSNTQEAHLNQSVSGLKIRPHKQTTTKSWYRCIAPSRGLLGPNDQFLRQSIQSLLHVLQGYNRHGNTALKQQHDWPISGRRGSFRLIFSKPICTSCDILPHVPPSLAQNTLLQISEVTSLNPKSNSILVLGTGSDFHSTRRSLPWGWVEQRDRGVNESLSVWMSLP
jgi:hypothetical protein